MNAYSPLRLGTSVARTFRAAQWLAASMIGWALTATWAAPVATDGTATSPAEEAAEEMGIHEPRPAWVPPADPLAREVAVAALVTRGLLLIPDSTHDRVMAFDPATGDLLDANFIPADHQNLATPIQAVLRGSGDEILVSDQVRDAILRYDLDGHYLGVFAPAHRTDRHPLRNPRGMTLLDDGGLLVASRTVTSQSRQEIGTVARLARSGAYLERWAEVTGSPFDVVRVRQGGRAVAEGDLLVSTVAASDSSPALIRLTDDGSQLGTLEPLGTFPQQMIQARDGHFLICHFSGPREGIVELDAHGLPVAHHRPAELSGFRGIHELPNGNLLTTTRDGVFEVDRHGRLVSTKIERVSARFIEHAGPRIVAPPPPATVVEVSALSAPGIAGLVALFAVLSLIVLRRRKTTIPIAASGS